MSTKISVLKILAFSASLVYPGLLFSQATDYINGKIINSSTKDPVPFATVKLKYNQLGVYANAGGDFKLNNNVAFQTDSLIITCIGFKRISLPFRNLSNNEVNNIYLKPAVYTLAEVRIKATKIKLSSRSIVERAIRNIQKNYPVKPFSFIGYYRDYQKKGDDYLNLNEAIVQTLDSGFNSNSASNVCRLLDFRKNTEFPRMNISPHYDSVNAEEINSFDKNIPEATLGDQYGNELFILMVHDAIRNFDVKSFSFVNTFSKDFLLNHNFSEPVRVYNNNLLLYKIIFNAKSNLAGNSLMVSGAIYIQPKDYSIHKLEYKCFYQNKGNGLKEMFNIDTEYGYENAVDSLMCLKYISFNNFFNVQDQDDSSYFRIVKSYWGKEKFRNPATSLKPTLVLEFNKTIDQKSTTKRENYRIISGNKKLGISDIQAIDNKVYLRLKNDNYDKLHDSCRVTVLNLKDIDGNVVGRRKVLEMYQYREFFVQEYNKSLPLNDSCFIQYMPLEQNCLSKYSGIYNYWMNTPENIKPVK